MYVHFLQRMQQEFQISLTKMASVDSRAESEPPDVTSTDPSGTFPPQVLRTYLQHAADYSRLMMPK